MSTLNFNDPAAVAEWLGNLRASLKDADWTTTDMLRPKRERELGPKLHREHYEGAWHQVEQAMEQAGAPLDEPDGEPKPPASGPRPSTPKPEGDDGPKGAA